ncbi:hypothetical protein L9F63_006998, partial [Diploptera punctata]
MAAILILTNILCNNKGLFQCTQHRVRMLNCVNCYCKPLRSILVTCPQSIRKIRIRHIVHNKTFVNRFVSRRRESKHPILCQKLPNGKFSMEVEKFPTLVYKNCCEDKERQKSKGARAAHMRRATIHSLSVFSTNTLMHACFIFNVMCFFFKRIV